MRLPHPIPYQGSKRRLAASILAPLGSEGFARLYEPFAGSAAISIAAASVDLADEYVIGDSLPPLADLWKRVLTEPDQLADDYANLWAAQLPDPRQHFLDVRTQFNSDHEPTKLLYLLARCVKNSPRWNSAGDFNQSADHRRKGMNPTKMRREIRGAGDLLGPRATVRSADFRDTIRPATSRDLVYLDPPWEGTSAGVDKRYHAWLGRADLVAALEELNARDVPWILSYDGRHGKKEYGAPLPEDAVGLRLELEAGRSSQATLNGETAVTIESLYVSGSLVEAFQRGEQQQQLFQAA